MITSASPRWPSTGITASLKLVTACPSGLTTRIWKADVGPRPCCLLWRSPAMWKKSRACIRVAANTPSVASMAMRMGDMAIVLIGD